MDKRDIHLTPAATKRGIPGHGPWGTRNPMPLTTPATALEVPNTLWPVEDLYDEVVPRYLESWLSHGTPCVDG